MNDVFYKTNSISDKFSLWCEELKFDEDKEFLLNGIQNGFKITSLNGEEDIVNEVCVTNHPSVKKYEKLVENELLSQLAIKNYVFSETKPAIISPLAAIKKDNTDEVRLIHDASRPIGNALNDHATPSSITYESIDDAVSLLNSGSYMAKIDLRAAYRSVAIHPSDYKYTGLCFNFTDKSMSRYFFDTRLPFGSCLGPMIFHRISQSVKRMMSRKGYNNIIVYLDDFLCVADSYEECVEVQHVLISLLIKLGFQISWKKVVGPCQRVEFLGIVIDSVQGTLSLSDEKVVKLKYKLNQFDNKVRATKRQLQSLAGSLNWACQAVQGGRFFLRRILDNIDHLKNASHKCKLTCGFKSDLKWWNSFLKVFNGTVFFRQSKTAIVHTDACNEGAGMFLNGMCHYTHWSSDLPRVAKMHINFKEVIASVLAIERWAHILCDHDVTIVTDSMVTKGILNKGRTNNAYTMGWLRHLFWILVSHNIRLKVIHVPGVINQIPDAISRLHECGQGLRLFALLKLWHRSNFHVDFIAFCRSFMSAKSFQVAGPHLLKWKCRFN